MLRLILNPARFLRTWQFLLRGDYIVDEHGRYITDDNGNRITG